MHPIWMCGLMGKIPIPTRRYLLKEISLKPKTVKISAQYNGILEVKGGLTVNISDKGSFYIANSKNVPISLKVGKDFTFSNHITKKNNFDPNDLFFDASIGTAAAEIDGDFILQGANDAPTTYFQIANSKGAGVKAANIQVIGSDNNTTSLLFSRSSIVNVGSGNGVIETETRLEMTQRFSFLSGNRIIKLSLY